MNKDNHKSINYDSEIDKSSRLSTVEVIKVSKPNSAVHNQRSLAKNEENKIEENNLFVESAESNEYIDSADGTHSSRGIDDCP